jgi:hypothetical protein
MDLGGIIRWKEAVSNSAGAQSEDCREAKQQGEDRDHEPPRSRSGRAASDSLFDGATRPFFEATPWLTRVAHRGGGRSVSNLASSKRGRDKPVALPGDSLHEAGLFGIVAERTADFPDGGVDAVPGVYEDIVAPEMVDNLLTADEITVSHHQQDEEFHGDFFELEDVAGPAQLITSGIEFEIREFDFRERHFSPPQIHESIASKSRGPRSNGVFSAI